MRPARPCACSPGRTTGGHEGWPLAAGQPPGPGWAGQEAHDGAPPWARLTTCGGSVREHCWPRRACSRVAAAASVGALRNVRCPPEAMHGRRGVLLCAASVPGRRGRRPRRPLRFALAPPGRPASDAGPHSCRGLPAWPAQVQAHRTPLGRAALSRAGRHGGRRHGWCCSGPGAPSRMSPISGEIESRRGACCIGAGCRCPLSYPACSAAPAYPHPRRARWLWDAPRAAVADGRGRQAPRVLAGPAVCVGAARLDSTRRRPARQPSLPPCRGRLRLTRPAHDLCGRP